MPHGLDRPQSKASYRFFVVLFIFLVCSVVSALFYATHALEYTWNWGRVPSYFWDLSQQDIRTESNGQVTNIVHSNNLVIVTITSNNFAATVEEITLPHKVVLSVDKGADVYRGDIIGTFQANKPGLLLKGLGITVKVSFFAILFGIVIGLVTGLCRLSRNPCLRWFAITYIEIIRGTPLLVQLFLWYYVMGTIIDALLGRIGISPISPVSYGVFALAVFAGAYVAEIVRAGIQSVHWGQIEAARSLGMTHAQAMRKVVLPQAFRRIMPPLAGQFISLIKDSSLLGVLGIAELTKQTQDAISFTFQTFEFWFTCAVLYLILTFTLSVCIQFLEQKAIRR